MQTKNTRSVGLSTLNSRWPNGVVPYEIDPAAAYSQAQIDLILFSMNEMTTKTGGCIKFAPRTSLHRNWITIRNGAGCNSFVMKITIEIEKHFFLRIFSFLARYVGKRITDCQLEQKRLFIQIYYCP